MTEKVVVVEWNWFINDEQTMNVLISEIGTKKFFVLYFDKKFLSL